MICSGGDGPGMLTLLSLSLLPLAMVTNSLFVLPLLLDPPAASPCGCGCSGCASGQVLAHSTGCWISRSRGSCFPLAGSAFPEAPLDATLLIASPSLLCGDQLCLAETFADEEITFHPTETDLLVFWDSPTSLCY